MTAASSTRRSVARLIDANANRALEGLRVCEELARFHLASPRLFARFRALRHGVAAAVRALPLTATDLARARDAIRDPGRRAPASRIRSLERLLLINFQRAKESLRTLEECARVLRPRASSAFQHLRFRTYDLERDTLLALATLRHR